MMIPILKDYYAYGYLATGDRHHLPAYLPNCNMALRREVLKDVPQYDPDCLAGEDADFCRRAGLAGWELFYQPSARVWHESRPGLIDLIRQWWWYGRDGAHFFSKQLEKKCEIFLNLELTPKMHHYHKVFSLGWFPVKMMLFFSWFFIFHLLLLMVILGFALGLLWPSVCLTLGMLGFTFRQFLHSPLRKLTPGEFLLYWGVTWFINWSCILSSLRGGLRKNMLFIYPGI